MAFKNVERILEAEVIDAHAIPRPIEGLYRPDRQTKAQLREDLGKALRAYTRVKLGAEVAQEEMNADAKLAQLAIHNERKVDDAVIANCADRPGGVLQDNCREIQAAWHLGQVRRAYNGWTDES